MKNKAKSGGQSGGSATESIFKDMPKKEPAREGSPKTDSPQKNDGKTDLNTKKSPPLKGTLLTVMQNHDRFIERVRKENNIKDR